MKEAAAAEPSAARRRLRGKASPGLERMRISAKAATEDILAAATELEKSCIEGMGEARSGMLQMPGGETWAHDLDSLNHQLQKAAAKLQTDGLEFLKAIQAAASEEDAMRAQASARGALDQFRRKEVNNLKATITICKRKLKGHKGPTFTNALLQGRGGLRDGVSDHEIGCLPRWPARAPCDN